MLTLDYIYDEHLSTQYTLTLYDGIGPIVTSLFQKGTQASTEWLSNCSLIYNSNKAAAIQTKQLNIRVGALLF